MGGGATKCVDLAKLDVTPKHDKDFFMELEFECADFPTAPFWNNDARTKKREGADGVAKTVRSVFIKMYGENTPYACENFRRLCNKSVENGGYIGTNIHSVKPGISYNGGRIAGKNASAFGKPFPNEGEEDIEHEAYSVSMVSAGNDKQCRHKLDEGTFGSEFAIAGKSIESGSVTASLLDQSEGSFVVGKVVEGFLAFELLESLMASRKWMSLQAQSGNTGSIKNFNTSPGGAPPVPVVLKAAKEVTWAKKRREHRHSKSGIFNAEVFGSPKNDDQARRVAAAKKAAAAAKAARRFDSDQETEESKESSAMRPKCSSSGSGAHTSASVVSSNKKSSQPSK